MSQTPTADLVALAAAVSADPTPDNIRDLYAAGFRDGLDERSRPDRFREQGIAAVRAAAVTSCAAHLRGESSPSLTDEQRDALDSASDRSQQFAEDVVEKNVVASIADVFAPDATDDIIRGCLPPILANAVIAWADARAARSGVTPTVGAIEFNGRVLFPFYVHKTGRVRVIAVEKDTTTGAHTFETYTASEWVAIVAHATPAGVIDRSPHKRDPIADPRLGDRWEYSDEEGSRKATIASLHAGDPIVAIFDFEDGGGEDFTTEDLTSPAWRYLGPAEAAPPTRDPAREPRLGDRWKAPAHGPEGVVISMEDRAREGVRCGVHFKGFGTEYAFLPRAREARGWTFVGPGPDPRGEGAA